MSQHRMSTSTLSVRLPWKGLTSPVTHWSCAPTVCLHRSECLGQAAGRQTLCPATRSGHVVPATLLQLHREEVTVACDLLMKHLDGLPGPLAPQGADQRLPQSILCKARVQTGRRSDTSSLRVRFAVGFRWAIWHSVLNLSLSVIFGF